MTSNKLTMNADVMPPSAGLANPPAAPVKIWSFIGVLVLCCISYSLFKWFTSDHFRPSPTGLDPLPAGTFYFIRILEVLGVSGGLALIWYCLVNPWRKNGEVSWDGMLCITAFSLWYLDPVDNYFNFNFAYNAHFYNMTSWTTYIPGWVSPRQENFPEPLFLLSGMYIMFLCGFTLLACKVLTLCKTRWLPNRSVLVHLAVVFVVFALVDFAIEAIFCRYEIFNYGGVYAPLTLWAGEYYQFPIYESLCVSGIVTVLACLRYFKDDRGYSFAERGIQHLHLSKPKRKFVSFLAILGFAHTVFLLVFFVPYLYFSLKVDTFAKTSSYLRFEVCGEGTPNACAGSEVPIPSKTSLTIAPDDPRLSPKARAN